MANSTKTYRLPLPTVAAATLGLAVASAGVWLGHAGDVARLLDSARVQIAAWSQPAPARHTRAAPRARPPAPKINETDPGPLPQVLRQMTPEQAQAFNGSIAFSRMPVVAARPFALTDVQATDHQRALTCLALAVYYEAASQSDDGEAAVAQVVLNRLRNPLFPKTVCGVVFEGSKLPTGCQFTFTCDGSLNRQPSAAGWKRASAIAERALNGYVLKSVGEATHYHTVWVVPYWQSSLLKVAQIGAHIFYRWPGGLGEPEAFRGEYAGSEDLPMTALATGVEPALQVIPLAPVATASGLAGAAPNVDGSVDKDRPTVQIEPAPAPALQLSQLVAPAQLSIPAPRTSYFGHQQEQRGRLPIPGG